MSARRRRPGVVRVAGRSALRVSGRVGACAGVTALGAGVAVSGLAIAPGLSPAWAGMPAASRALPTAALPDLTPAFSGAVFTVADVGRFRPEVRAWQARMAALGYRIGVDGLFGPQSSGVAAAFERAHQLPVTGQVDAQVWNLAFGLSPIPEPAPTASPVPVTASFSGAVFTVADVGRFRPEVRAWQARMAALGYRIGVDGLFGPQSSGVAAAFERAHQLPVTGQVDAQVWNLAFGLSPIPEPAPTASPAPVTAVPVTAVPVTAVPVTAVPVTAVQPVAATTPVWVPPALPAIPGLAPGGWLGAADPVPAPWGGTVLTTALAGHWQSAVWQWQQRMVHAGYALAVDGNFGSQSAAVATSFAQQAGLANTPPGTVDQAGWNAAFASPESGPRVDPAGGALGAVALSLAAEQNGAPYVYGGAGPASFDCSGLVSYVFDYLGWSLPHNAELQYQVVTHIPVSALQPGDLVFFPDSTGTIYHDGIYAGNNMMWDAPHAGATVSLAPIWTTDILAGRVG